MKSRTFDLPMGETGPQPGDLLSTPLRLYRVLAVEPVETRIRCDRWRLDCELVAKRTRATDPWPVVPAMELGCRYWPSVPYQKGEPPSVVWGTDR